MLSSHDIGVRKRIPYLTGQGARMMRPKVSFEAIAE
jgi:hypothetical protein